MIGPLTGWLGEWTAAVGDHHERWDGAGYPAGLAGNDISLAGRIVAVADTFDVITATRSYKPSQSPQWARTELANNAGSQFDPEVVRAFLNISLGKLRGVMWPLSWIAHVPFLASTATAPSAGRAARPAGLSRELSRAQIPLLRGRFKVTSSVHDTFDRYRDRTSTRTRRGQRRGDHVQPTRAPQRLVERDVCRIRPGPRGDDPRCGCSRRDGDRCRRCVLRRR